jgi:[ribosomal protein S5]-alanine N-acetyltransferase
MIAKTTFNIQLPNKLESDRLLLRTITTNDATETYLKWITDPEITQFLESRFQKHSLESLREFISAKSNRDEVRMFAIETKNEKIYIGNVIIGPISWEHRRADIGIMIGDLNHTGKGYATDAIMLVSKFAFDHLNLRKLCAGCYFPNKASLRAFQKAGFEIECVLKKHFLYRSEFIDCYLLSLFNHNA